MDRDSLNSQPCRGPRSNRGPRTYRRRMKSKIAFFVLALCLVATRSQAVYNLTGYVLDPDGNSVPGAQWRVTAVGTWRPNGYTEINLTDNVQTYIETAPAQNFYSPPTTNFFASGGSYAITNTYIPYTNTLVLTVTGAPTDMRWQITDYPSQFTNSSAFKIIGTNTTTLTPIPTGTYTVVFSGAKGADTAPTTNIDVSVLSVWSTNTYPVYSNNLAVTIVGYPAGNCEWSIDTPVAFTNATGYKSVFTNDVSLTGVPTGTYTFGFPGSVGYITPTNTLEITDAITNTLQAIYVLAYPTNIPIGTGIQKFYQKSYFLTNLFLHDSGIPLHTRLASFTGDFLADGSVPMTGNLNFGGQRGTNATEIQAGTGTFDNALTLGGNTVLTNEPVFIASAAYSISGSDTAAWWKASADGIAATASVAVVEGLANTNQSRIAIVETGMVARVDSTYTATVWKAVTAYGWGDHALVGYLTTEALWIAASNTVVYAGDSTYTDTVAKAASALQSGAAGTSTNLSGYNDDVGYATGTPVYVESDPVWESEKGSYATGTPVYVELDPVHTNWLANGYAAYTNAQYTIDTNQTARIVLMEAVTGANAQAVADSSSWTNNPLSWDDGGSVTNMAADELKSGTVDNARLDADLQTYAGITPSANMQTFLAEANYAAMRTSMSVEIGVNVQAWDADLDKLALNDGGNLTNVAVSVAYGITDSTAYRGDWGNAASNYAVTGSNLAYSASTNAEAARVTGTNALAIAEAALPKSSTNALAVTALQITGGSPTNGAVFVATNSTGLGTWSLPYALNPVGTIQMYGGAAAPSGWLLCDGSAVSTNIYSALFDVIGTTFGGATTNMNLPDMRGVFPKGAGTTDRALGVDATTNAYAAVLGTYYQDKLQGIGQQVTIAGTAMGQTGGGSAGPLVGANAARDTANLSQTAAGFVNIGYGTPRIGNSTEPQSLGLTYIIYAGK